MLQKSVSNINFSFDLWTSPNHLALLGLVAHFIDEKGQNQSMLIAIRQLKGPHTGENQAEVIISIIRDYGIQDRIGYFVTDNASNNDTAIDPILQELCPHLTQKQRKQRRLRCLGHVINLAAKAFLYGEEADAFEEDVRGANSVANLLRELKLWRKRGPVGKLHNTIIFICRSPQRREKFASSTVEGELREVAQLSLLVGNATRWNSLYTMIVRALKLRDRIDLFYSRHGQDMHGARGSQRAQNDEDHQLELARDQLLEDDWNTLAEIVEILKPYYKLTKYAEGSSLTGHRGVLSNYLTILNRLVVHSESIKLKYDALIASNEYDTPSNQYLRTCAVNCWTKIDEYFSKMDETPAHYAAVITSPVMKFRHFTTNWASKPAWIATARKSRREIWAEYKSMDIPIVDTGVADQVRRREPTDYEISMDMVALLKQEEGGELEQWNNDRPFYLDAYESLPQFWFRKSKQRSTYRLAKLGLDMVSIPAMSSECERVFSQCKLLITGQRCRIKSDLIEATQCLRMWLIMDRKSAGKWSGKGNWITPIDIVNNTGGEDDNIVAGAGGGNDVNV